MKKINTAFICISCKRKVPRATKTCRNHCPYCFFSLHVDDIVPGDRASICHGNMLPTMYKRTNGMIKILFVCQTCNKEHRNKVADDDEIGVLDTYIILYKENYSRD